MQHHSIQVAGKQLHYVQAQPNDVNAIKGTMVFLHGFPEYWATWQAQMRFFAQEYRVIAIDLFGYNLSGKSQSLSDFEVPNLIQLYAQAIKALGQGNKVFLVAHDWGGAIAWPLTAFHTDLIEKLIILNAAHPSTFTREMMTNPEQRQKSAYIYQLITEDAEQFIQADNFKFLRQMLFEQVKKQELTADQSWQNGYLQAWSQSGAVSGMLNYYRAMPQLAAPSAKSQGDENNAQLTTLEEIKIPNIRINVPTLVLWGEQDKAFVNAILDGLDEYVPNLLVQRFTDATHWLHHEKPDEINRAINSFIQD